MRKKFLVPVAATIGVMSLLVPSGFNANPAQSAPAPAPANDQRYASEIVRKGTLPIVDSIATDGSAIAAKATARAAAADAAAAGAPLAIGAVKPWLGLDDIGGFYYRKNFQLKGLNDKTEVWVAVETLPAPTRGTVVGNSTGTQFLDGDCRNNRAEVTEAQAQYLADQFANNMLPKESAAFSVAPPRDGTNAVVPNPPYDPTGNGERTVVLVDNVRDDNFYDLNNTQGLSFIAGFFSTQLNTFFDRNVMTIDGFDWIHRTGANPPNEPVPGNNCTSAPARPFAYEGVFAHEYQHLLHSYTDPDESTWVNEGLSDYAEVITGYVNAEIPIQQIGFESHTQCFLGFLSQLTDANPNPRARSGPENSLTRWEDQSGAEILCDYGAAFTFMQYANSRYGLAFITALHNGKANGLAAVQEALTAVGDIKTKPLDLVHDWSLMVAVDAILSRGAQLKGPYRKADLTSSGIDASINWDTPEAYSSPGAPSNGSDYVRLRSPEGVYYKAKDIESLSFEGATALPAAPLAWTVDANPPGQAGNAALYSGAADSRDESAVTPITVPAAPAALTFNARWNQEDTWDYGFVQISDDGGSTYKTIPCTDTTANPDPGADSTVVANLPGFTGSSGGWKPQTCDLSGYAGKSVLLAFRTINDGATLGNGEEIPVGLWVDDVNVGTTVVSDGSSLTAFKSVTQTKPVSVAGFYVNLISVSTSNGKGNHDRDDDRDEFDVIAGETKADRAEGDRESTENPENRGDRRTRVKVTVKRVPLTTDFTIKGRAKIRKLIDRKADFVGAVITYDDPTETVQQYAPYKLTVNGVVQPGGGMG
jgi:hypothetical protein